MQQVEPITSSPIDLTISVISHGHYAQVRKLLKSLEDNKPSLRFEVLLTLNIPESEAMSGLSLSFPVRIVENVVPRGFAANHNEALRLSCAKYFCILNPDVVFVEEVYGVLLGQLENSNVAVVSPRVIDSSGVRQDSFRRMPLPSHLVARFFGNNQLADAVVVAGNNLAMPDWIAGMFLLMKSEVFRKMKGFDERYFLYFEDVDLGVRCRLAGLSLIADMNVTIVHDAQRDSRKHFRFLALHIISAVKFYTSTTFWQARKKLG